MRTIISLAAGLLLLCLSANGQVNRVEQIKNLKSNKLSVESNYSKIELSTWDKDFIEITSVVVSESSNIMEYYNITTENTAKGVLINSVLDMDNVPRKVIFTDEDGNVTYQIFKEYEDIEYPDGVISANNVGYDLEAILLVKLPTDMSIDLENLYGSVELEGQYQKIDAFSTYGNVEARLQNVSSTQKVKLISGYSLVDLMIDPKSNATLNLSTSFGQIYSDLPMQEKGKASFSDKNGHCGTSGSYVMNDGSVPISITSTYNNIYLRKPIKKL